MASSSATLPERVLPIGNLTSQWWGNLYLDSLDHHAQRSLKVAAWQRYMDDLTLFDDDPARLVDTREAIAAWLAEHRHLELKDPLAEPAPTHRPSLYLGYHVAREGFSLGRKARGRIHAHLARAANHPERLRATVAALSAAWMFGWRYAIPTALPAMSAADTRMSPDDGG